MIKCIIFDCDGTLVDSEYLCNLGFEIKLREYGVVYPAQEIMAKHVGSKMDTILESFESTFNLDLREDFVISYRTIVADLFKEHLKPCQGVPEMLATIHLPICVASNAPREKISLALSLTGLSQFFKDNIFSAYDVDSWKPDPKLFLNAAKVMGFKPEECAVVEDSLVGLAAAKSAGMLAVLYDPHGIHRPMENTTSIAKMSQLVDAISYEQSNKAYL